MRKLTPQNAGGEPSPGDIPDQQHGTRAVDRRRRVQSIVDLEVAVGLERNAGQCRIAQGKWGRRLTNQRGEYALVRIACDAVATSQQQTPSLDPNPPVVLDLGPKLPDYPDLACGLYSADNVPIHDC